MAEPEQKTNPVPAESHTLPIKSNHICWHCSKQYLDEHPDIKEQIHKLRNEGNRDMAKELKRAHQQYRDFNIQSFVSAMNSKTKMAKGKCSVCGTEMCRILSIGKV